MTLLFSVITAAYGKGTHHRLALDGVNRLAGPDAAAWQRLFFKHAEVLVTGSKAPDDQFKDFKNHVLHPRDNFWGGAPDKARSWYVDLVETLAKGDWPAAVWCAGVLSHYVTDPINPFHTAQSEAENAIHRAFEWSISTSYADLKKLANADAPRTINVTDGPDWLERLVCQAASDANQHYEKLIAHYDIHRGVVDPPSGLDSIAQKIIGDLIGQASAVFATVLERAITESKAAPPDVSLTLDMILATLKIPLAKLVKKLANAEERRLVERMYDELKATGTVEVNLPEDDRMVRDLHAAEVLGKQAKPSLDNRFPEKGRRKTAETDGEQKERLKRIGPRSIPAPGAAKGAKPAASAATGAEAQSARELPVDEPARPAPRAADQAKPAGPVSRFRGEPVPEAPRQAAEKAAAEPAAAKSSVERRTAVEQGTARETEAAKVAAAAGTRNEKPNEPVAPVQPAALHATLGSHALPAADAKPKAAVPDKARVAAPVSPAASAPSVNGQSTPDAIAQRQSALPAASVARLPVEQKPAAAVAAQRPSPAASPVQMPVRTQLPAATSTPPAATPAPQPQPIRSISTSVPSIAAKPAAAASPAASTATPPSAAATAPTAPTHAPASPAADVVAAGSPQATELPQPTRLLRRLNQLPHMRPAGQQPATSQTAPGVQASVQPLQPRPAAVEQADANAGAPRLHLTPAQPIVDAPSIGPKMAERLVPLGIVTVGDLLKASAGNLAAKLAMSIIDADVITDWQDQARLVCTVPGLRGTHAQLLVGAGFRSAGAIADAEPAQLCARVLTFATAKEGQRILRNGEPPDIERIKSWVDNARAVKAA